ncbi:metal ABC transporter solute-binding protein, Zn/Mn family [Larsenimonas suaedae]|uniref:High-affinity zinc uptake system protein ZnuA n=1 Tax=Larsenimonas suaedae TaxID=1851019 RepID=A0ABU1GX88_9GAMM|nr:zinc ABC transporter substrate-binding protein [Larsenimonas suaedae]MCM2971341.1 zinc ABC transporter substrate-binding protein [Larsenimonas suaedae]MDR5896052.1 zinc ABC transporter substrate-binding protein [Larsenimonas suaedae]
MNVKALVVSTALFVTSLPVMAAPLQVSTSILPEKWLIEQLGGDSVEVQALVEEGKEPEDFSPSPRQLSTLTQSTLYFAIGVPFEQAWLERFEQRAPEMKVFHLDQGLKKRAIEAHAESASGADAHGAHSHESHGHDAHEHAHHDEHQASHGHSHHEGQPDPHVWLDPDNMIVMAQTAADALSDALPDQAEAIEAREQALIQKIEHTTDSIERELAPYKGQSFMVYHPAFGYFGDRFGLNQLPIELNGREPTPQALNALIKTAHDQNIHTIFIQKQFSTRIASRLADEIDGTVVAIDPLSPDYLSNLEHIADALKRGFSNQDG